jgi:hypothetical protein
MADRDEFYDPEEEDDSPPESPDKGPVDSGALDQDLEQTLADLEAAESEASEPPEPQAQDDGDYGITESPALASQEFQEPEADPQEFVDQEFANLTAEDQEGSAEPASEASSSEQSDFGSVTPWDVPPTLRDYAQRQAERGGDGGELPDSGIEPEEEEAPDWGPVFTVSKNLNSTMRDMLVEHETDMSEILRSLESSRW